MSVDGIGTEQGGGGADEPGWDVDPDDEPGVAVVAAVGRQIKAWREAAGMRAGAFNGRSVTGSRQLRILELRYGIIRAEARTPPGDPGPHRTSAGRDTIRRTSAQDVSELVWFKSSNGNEGDCVEVAAAPESVHVRDSKNVQGARPAFASGAWAGFVPYVSGR